MNKTITLLEHERKNAVEVASRLADHERAAADHDADLLRLRDAGKSLQASLEVMQAIEPRSGMIRHDPLAELRSAISTLDSRVHDVRQARQIAIEGVTAARRAAKAIEQLDAAIIVRKQQVSRFAGKLLGLMSKPFGDPADAIPIYRELAATVERARASFGGRDASLELQERVSKNTQELITKAVADIERWKKENEVTEFGVRAIRFTLPTRASAECTAFFRLITDLHQPAEHRFATQEVMNESARALYVPLPPAMVIPGGFVHLETINVTVDAAGKIVEVNSYIRRAS